MPAPSGAEARVLDELARLQDAVWAAEAEVAELRALLAAAVPLLAHPAHDTGRACRRCDLLDAALPRLRRPPHVSSRDPAGRASAPAEPQIDAAARTEARPTD